MPTGWPGGRRRTGWSSRCRSTRSTWAVGSGPATIPTRWLSYRDLAHQLAEYCKEMGYTHVELLPVSEHPLSASWGYQTVGYYAATSRYGTPQDFMYFVDVLHQNGIGVILDWVPAHFPRDGHGLRQFDGTALYEHADPRRGEHRDWGTQDLQLRPARGPQLPHLQRPVLDGQVPHRRHPRRRRGLDALPRLQPPGRRLAAQRVRRAREPRRPSRFLKELNEQAHVQHPGVLTIAEESTAWPGVSRPTYLGGLGFSLKWNMGWMNDTRSYMRHDPIHRRYHHDELTFSLIYAFHENFVLPMSHDEVVHGKGSLLDQMPGDLWQKFANLRLLYSYMWTHPGKKLLFMGSDFGQWNEWNFDASLQWDLLQWDSHQGLLKCVADLNRLYRREKVAARGRFRLSRLRVDRLPQPRRQHAELRPPGERPARLPGDRLQLHARAAGGLSPGRARAVLVRRGLQQRLVVLRRQQPGQRPGRDGRADPQPRPARLDPHHLSAAGRLRLQAAKVTRANTFYSGRKGTQRIQRETVRSR